MCEQKERAIKEWAQTEIGRSDAPPPSVFIKQVRAARRRTKTRQAFVAGSAFAMVLGAAAWVWLWPIGTAPELQEQEQIATIENQSPPPTLLALRRANRNSEPGEIVLPGTWGVGWTGETAGLSIGRGRWEDQKKNQRDPNNTSLN